MLLEVCSLNFVMRWRIISIRAFLLNDLYVCSRIERRAVRVSGLLLRAITCGYAAGALLIQHWSFDQWETT